VHLLRTLHNALASRGKLTDGTRVILGAGWIGCEVAAAHTRGAQVTMVDPAPLPLRRVLGDQVGQRAPSNAWADIASRPTGRMGRNDGPPLSLVVVTGDDAGPRLCQGRGIATSTLRRAFLPPEKAGGHAPDQRCRCLRCR
jgi:Pyridine nucleotide-disulphide oxidoreductase